MTRMTDDELEQHIADCGRLMLEEMAAGNREVADGWRVDMEHAIAQRSPEQIARMEAERGLLPEPCYFHDQGERDLPAMYRRQAA